MNCVCRNSNKDLNVCLWKHFTSVFSDVYMKKSLDLFLVCHFSPSQVLMMDDAGFRKLALGGQRVMCYFCQRPADRVALF